MSRTIHKTDKPVTLEGFQAILAPSKFGYSFSAIVDSDTVDKLETERLKFLSGLNPSSRILSEYSQARTLGRSKRR